MPSLASQPPPQIQWPANGIDEADHDEGKEEERGELDPLGDRSGNDGRRRAGEDELKEELRPQRDPGPVERAVHAVVGVSRGRAVVGAGEEPDAARPDETAAVAEHQAESGQEKRHRGDREHDVVLRQDVRRVLRPAEAGLHQRKAEVHEEHEERRDERPHRVHRDLGVRDRVGHLLREDRSGRAPAPAREARKPRRRAREVQTTATSRPMHSVRSSCMSMSSSRLRSAVYRSSRSGSRQIALLPCSPVRIRTTSSTGRMKIFPSPIFPVRAVETIVSTAFCASGVVEQNLDLDLGKKVDDVFGATVELGVTLLPTEPLHLGHGHSLDALLRQRVLHLVELEGLDDGFDLLHGLLRAREYLARPGGITSAVWPAAACLTDAANASPVDPWGPYRSQRTRRRTSDSPGRLAPGNTKTAMSRRAPPILPLASRPRRSWFRACNVRAAAGGPFSVADIRSGAQSRGSTCLAAHETGAGHPDS